MIKEIKLLREEPQMRWHNTQKIKAISFKPNGQKKDSIFFLMSDTNGQSY